MAIQRVIQHPGVEIREIDKSQYTPAIAGTYCALAGYSDKGEEHEPMIVTSVQDFTTNFGEPTNEAERYFYYAGQEVIRTGGTLVAAKLPYANLISRNYKAIGIKIESAQPISNFNASYSGSQSGISTVTSGQLSAVGYSNFIPVSSSEIQQNITTSEYDQLLAGLTTNDASFPTNFVDQDFLIVNKNKETIQGTDKNEGLIVAVVDPIDAMNVQRILDGASDSDAMDLISGFEVVQVSGSTPTQYVFEYDPQNQTWSSNDFSSQLINTYKGDSVSEDIMKQFPTIEFMDGGDTINKEYSHHLGIVVLRVFADSYNEGKLKVGILEAFVGSIHPEMRDKATGQSIYLGDKVNAGSKYINMFFNSTANRLPTWDLDVQMNDDVLYKPSDVYPLIGFPTWETQKLIKGGQIVNELQKIYEKLSNIDDVQLDVIVDGGLSTIAQFTDDDPVNGTYYDPVEDVDPDDINIDSSASLATWRAVCDEMITFCKDIRKDCMAIVDVPRHLVLEANSKYIRKTAPDNTFSNTIGQKLKYVTGLNSSYAALYGNWFRQVDQFSGNSFWIPQSIKMAGIYVYNDRIANIWDAPAGLNRGVIFGVNDIAYNPNGKSADQLYIKSINYAKKYPLDGFIAEGQKTTQVKPSAFDRVNVRRLFLRLERLVYEVSRYFVYEPNNFFTRRRLVDMVEPIFSRVKQQGGMYDYKIVCNETNNTPDVIDRNELKIAFFIKPVKTVEFILVDFVAVSTGTNFSEVVNEVL